MLAQNKAALSRQKNATKPTAKTAPNTKRPAPKKNYKSKKTEPVVEKVKFNNGKNKKP